MEFDSPENLLSNEESAFSKMVQSTGPSNAEYLKVLCIKYWIHFANLAMLCHWRELSHVCMQSCTSPFVLIYTTGFRGVLIHLSFWMKNDHRVLYLEVGRRDHGGKKSSCKIFKGDGLLLIDGQKLPNLRLLEASHHHIVTSSPWKLLREIISSGEQRML